MNKKVLKWDSELDITDIMADGVVDDLERVQVWTYWDGLQREADRSLENLVGPRPTLSSKQNKRSGPIDRQKIIWLSIVGPSTIPAILKLIGVI